MTDVNLKNSCIIRKTMREAEFKELDDGTFYGEVKSCPGVWANEKTLMRCRKVLQEILEEWLIIKEFEDSSQEEELAKGYKAISESDIEIYLPAQAEVVLRDDKAR